MNTTKRSVLLIALIFVISANFLVLAERFYPDKADKYPLTLQGKKVFFYLYKSRDYFYTSISEFDKLDLKYFKRNPKMCFSAKVENVGDDFIEFFNTKKKTFYPDSLKETAEKLKKGDNVWIFADLNIYEDGKFDINADAIFELESDEELFLKWRKDVKSDDPDGLIQLGLKALKYGKDNGNVEIWEKLGRKVIFRGLELKKEKITKPSQYIDLAKEVLNLLDDDEFAGQIVMEAWKKDKQNSELNHYLKNVLKFSLYKDVWYPVEKRYEKEFQDRFNAIGYTDDDKMWELKGWVERNSNKIKDPEEKIIRCAQRAFEMNPAREDAAAFLGKEPMLIKGVTSGQQVTIPRQPVVTKTPEGNIEFTIDNFWVKTTAESETGEVKYETGGKAGAFILVRNIEWGANLEEIKDKFTATLKDIIVKDTLKSEIITLNGRDYYRVEYENEENGTLYKQEVLIAEVGGDSPAVAISLTAAKSAVSNYSDEFSKIRASLKFTK